MRTAALLALALLAFGTAEGALLEELGILPPAVPATPPPDLDDVEPLATLDAPLPDPTPPTPPWPRAPALDAPTLAAATGGAALLACLGFALYSRLSRHELLENEHRQNVMDLVRSAPGITLTDVAHRSGLGWGTTVYHLERLQKAGMVASERSGTRRCYFATGSVPREARAGVGTLHDDTARSVATLVLERPGATQSELADALGLSASATSKQVTKLESHGLVRREREWKSVRVHPQPQLAALLA